MSRPNPIETFHGLWWLAGDPSKRVPGVLRIDDESKLTLDLHGALQEPTDATTGLPEGQFRVFGELEWGDLVALDNCFARDEFNPFATQQRQTWTVNTALIGAAMEPEDPWAFYGCNYSIPGLSRWVKRSATEHFLESSKAGIPERCGATLQVQAWPLWTLTDGSRAQLIQSFHVGDTSEFTTTIDAEVLAQLHGPTLKSKQEFRQGLTGPLLTLLTLSSGRFTCSTRGRVLLQPLEEGRVNSRTATLRWTPLDTRMKPEAFDFSFTYQDLAGLGTDALQNWVRRFEQIHHIIPFYTGTVRRMPYAEPNFFLSVQALEGYHRVDSGGDLKLKERLRALLDRSGAMANEICGEDSDSFVSKIVYTRNNYAHANADPDRKALHYEQLVHATERMLALVEVLLLQDLGFPEGHRVYKEVSRRRLSWL